MNTITLSSYDNLLVLVYFLFIYNLATLLNSVETCRSYCENYIYILFSYVLLNRYIFTFHISTFLSSLSLLYDDYFTNVFDIFSIIYSI